MSRTLCRRIWPGLLAGIVLLTGCATPPRVPPAELDRLWQQHRQSLQHKDDWTLTARLAGSTEEDGWSGKLSWQQNGENYQIHFQAPFGQGAAQLLGGPEQVEMRTSDEQVIIAEDAESLLYQQLGWRLPLKGLRYWVLGLPMPVTLSTDDEPLLALDPSGRLSRLQQSHWQVSYETYRRVGEVDLPQKIYLKNHSLNLRLVIDHWQLIGQ